MDLLKAIMVIKFIFVENNYFNIIFNFLIIITNFNLSCYFKVYYFEVIFLTLAK